MESSHIIAGPLLRRVEKRAVSVWLACNADPIERENIQLRMELKIYASDEVKMKAGADPLNDFSTVSGDIDPLPLAIQNEHLEAVEARTLMHRIGERLYVGVATFIPQVSFQAGEIYSYNVFLSDINRPGLHADFLSMGLLKNSGKDAERVQLAIGYKNGLLPTFCLPQDDEVSKLVISQASCRKAHGHGSDALALLDKELEDNRKTPDTRVQQLFLTGDQIYADDVPGALLRFLHDRDGKRIVADDKMKVDADGDPINIDLRKFPPFFRQRLVNNHAGLTSGSARCHALSFGEYCSLYLHYWNLRAWSKKLVEEISKLKENKKSTLDGVVDAIFDGADGEPGIADLIEDAIGSPTDLARLVDEESRDTFTPKSAGATALETQQKKKEEWLVSQKKKLRSELKGLYQFFVTLPKVSRVLANVPSYMIFDDHEVTDDWNLSRRWQNQVLSKPFGRDIMRNGLMAYCIFQDWGNRPEEYLAQVPEEGERPTVSNPTKLLRSILTFCEETQVRPDAANFRRRFVEPIEARLGLGDAAESDIVRWHYQVPTGLATSVVLDTRTRRQYDSLNSPPGLINSDGLLEQIPSIDPSGAASPFLIVVSPAPAPGLASFEELVQPAAAAAMGIGENGGKNPGVLTGMISADYEAWGFNTKSLEGLLDRLSDHKRVIILSGDVHYGFSSVLDYWKGNRHTPKSRIVTFTASALKNEEFGMLHMYRSGLAHKILTGIGDQLEKLGWKDRVLSVTGTVSIRNRQRLRSNPAVIPVAGWRPGARVNRAPDFRWRLSVLSDERVREESFIGEDDIAVGEDDVIDIVSVDAGYANVVQQHQADFISGIRRRMVWPANIGLLTFEEDGDELTVNHDFLFNAETRSRKPKAGKHVRHSVLLDATDDDATRPELP